MSVEATNNFGNIPLIDIPYVTKPLLEWHGKVVKAFEDSPQDLCDVMTRVVTVVGAIFIAYPIMGLISIVSLFCQPAKAPSTATAEKVDLFKQKALAKFNEEMGEWDQIFHEAEEEKLETIDYCIKLENSAQLSATDTPWDPNLTKTLKEEFAKKLESLTLSKELVWKAKFLILHNKTPESFSAILRYRTFGGSQYSSGDTRYDGFAPNGLDPLKHLYNSCISS